MKSNCLFAINMYIKINILWYEGDSRSLLHAGYTLINQLCCKYKIYTEKYRICLPWNHKCFVKCIISLITSLIVINMFDFFFTLIDYLHLINNYYKQNYHTSPPTRKIQQSTTIGPHEFKWILSINWIRLDKD